MTDTQTSNALDSAAVAEYLRNHPDFFVDNQELIPDLSIPHTRGDAVSLVEHQIKLLRKRNVETRHRLGELMTVARENDRLFDKTRRLVLGILDAASLTELIGTLEDSLRTEFQVPFVSLILYADTPLPVGRSVSHQEARQALGNLISNDLAICSALRQHELQFIFGGQGTEVGSAAVAALAGMGLLAVGSQDPRHYKNATGTLFLGYIAEVVNRVLPPLMQQPDYLNTP